MYLAAYVGGWEGYSDCGVEIMVILMTLNVVEGSMTKLTGILESQTSRGTHIMPVDVMVNNMGDIIIEPATPDDGFTLEGFYSVRDDTITGTITPAFPCPDFTLTRIEYSKF